jgi:DNA-binding NtrC family response regulator
MASVQHTVEAAGTPLPTLLIIEDEPMQSALIGRIADVVGFESTVARSMSDAMAMLQASAFDCITLDLSLRGDRGGTDILRALSVLGCQAQIVILSGATGLQLELTSSMARSFKLKVCDPMPKPVDPTLLRQLFTKIKNEVTAKATARAAG